MRILTLALGVPFPPLGGGLTRTFHLLKALSSEHEVTLLAFSYGEPHDIPPFPLRVVSVPWQWSTTYLEMVGTDLDASRRAYRRLTYEQPEPWFASVLDPAGMEQALESLLMPAPDLVLIEGTPLARFLPSLPANLPCVLDLFDVHSVMAQRALKAASDVDRPAAAREAERTLSFERHAIERCTACLVVSDDDAAAARSLLGASDVYVIPNGVDTTYFTPAPQINDSGVVLFTGRMNYAPNAAAAQYFAADILPLVRRELPETQFHIVGAAPAPEVSALASDGVVVHGRVEDVRPHLWRSDLVVVPVRSGGGTRLKVLEAAACGKAIVSTSLGVEGLTLERGRDVVVTDDASTFAEQVVRLLVDRRTRETLGRNARAAAGLYEWSAIGDKLREAVRRAGAVILE